MKVAGVFSVESFDPAVFVTLVTASGKVKRTPLNEFETNRSKGIVAITLAEGDEVAGFKVLHFPGHAPGLIALWRESDRVALVSDVVYLVDSARLKPLPPGEASVPHPAFAWNHQEAKRSVRRLAELEPLVVGTGHDAPLRGENLRPVLEAAAEKF